ncbi:TonB-dependent receptor [Olivibacter sp. SA151]|uniref:SusC/RagA family TonB-linked outer membrane protein n=1 Tax=Olivibacter jilunii TaxID=985016 RepID=UPI003F5CC5A3
MKLTWLMVFVFSWGVYAAGKAQQVSISLENAPLKEVLQALKRQTHYRFLYNEEQLKAAGTVSLKLHNVPVEEVLQKALNSKKLQYKRHNTTITIAPVSALSSSREMMQQQDLDIRGTVRDSVAALTGVSVFVKGRASNGTTTNANGQYQLKVPEGATLVFRFIGYAEKEVPVTNAGTIDVVLSNIESRLDEVVVVGYGTQKKGDLTGSIASLSADDLTKGGAISNVAQAIQGRASGVVVTQNSKAPGGSMSIRIRGSNSVSSSNEPLYVIDGFPSNNGVNINPDDIASMEILKDASATAIYGSRGANGVVMITTKRGKAGQSNVAYNGYIGTQKAINPYHLLDGKSYMLLANELYKEINGQEGIENGVYTQSQLNSTINTDWVKEATRTATVQNHNLQFTGGSEKTKVLSSVGYFDQKGILKTTDFKRVSGRVNIDQTINDYVRAGASIFGQRENSNYQIYDGNILNSNVLYSVLTYDPTVPVYDANGAFGRPPGGRGDNPLANLMARQNDVQKDKLNGNVYLEIKPFEGLTARFDAGTEILHDQLGTYLSQDSYQGSIDKGVASQSDYNLTHNLADMFITYDKGFGKHHLNVMGGYSYEKFTNSNKGINVYGFSTDLYGYNNLGAASTISGVNSYKSENMLISFFGRANYSFDDKYLFTFTVRHDGSSRFGSDNKWGTFPSGSFAWKLINESFMRNQQLFSDLKLRLGYGKTGNERIGNYASYGLMSNANYTFDGINNTSGTYLNSSSPANTRLKWETTSQYDAGIDFALLNDRIAVTMDAYYKKTSDLLIKLNLPLYSGYSSGQSNVGSVSNKGFEFAIATKNLTGAFTWDTKLNFAMNRNKVLDLGGDNDIFITSSKPMGTVSEEAYAIIREGEPLGSLFGYKYIGVIQQGEAYAPQPNSKAGDPKFADVNGDGIITAADRTIIGSAYPKLTYGITNTFAYKNFDLSVFIYGNLGNDLLNMTRMNLEWNRSTDALNRWTPENTNTDLPRNGFYYTEYGGYVNDHFVEDASFLRLKNLTLGYTVPFKTKAMQSLRIYVMAENLFTISGYSGWDPEVDTKGYENDALIKYSSNAQTANAGAGLDFNSYPSMRAFTFGVNVNF